MYGMGDNVFFRSVMQSRVCDSVVCVPDALKNLVGEDNARRGTIKVFEVLQNKRLNKHLIYVSVCGVLSSELPGMLLFFLVCLCSRELMPSGIGAVLWLRHRQ